MAVTRRKFLESLGIFGFLYALSPGTLLAQRDIQILRPPGALKNQKDFLAKCLRCYKCGQVCPANAIKYGGWLDGQNSDTPLLSDLRNNPCTLCMECTKVCPTGALEEVEPDFVTINDKVKIGTAKIDRSTCLVSTGQRRICHFCVRVCPYKGSAIYVGMAALPMVNPSLCVGCGLCEQACPVEGSAITVREVHQFNEDEDENV